MPGVESKSCTSRAKMKLVEFVVNPIDRTNSSIRFRKKLFLEPSWALVKNSKKKKICRLDSESSLDIFFLSQYIIKYTCYKIFGKIIGNNNYKNE